MASQEVQDALLQVRHPTMAPQGTHMLPLRNMPSKQLQPLGVLTKLLAVSQTWQVEALVQIRQPVLHCRQVLALNL